MFLTLRFYLLLLFVCLLMAGGYVFSWLLTVGQLAAMLLILTTLGECLLLYARRGITAERSMADRFSNGDDNKVTIRVTNHYAFGVKLTLIDELPFVFQKRDLCLPMALARGENGETAYTVRPTVRGEYAFGLLRIFASMGLRLVERRYSLCEKQQVKVYPSFLMLRHYELLAIHNRLSDMGIKRVRRVGYQTEFEQIKDYVQGDDYRLMNWKASARAAKLMVNVYQDERSQHVYSLIDKGRMMQQSFDGMTLLDYAINASLMLSYVAMRKEDRAGLLTFSDKPDTFLPAAQRTGQMEQLLELLYGQQTRFGETDFSALATFVQREISKRSLLVLYTQFPEMRSMERQLAYLRQLNKHHCLLVVYFEDMALRRYAGSASQTVEDYYRHVIAEKWQHEQRAIAAKLTRYGIQSIFTTPRELSVNVINKYIEMKARRLIG